MKTIMESWKKYQEDILDEAFKIPSLESEEGQAQLARGRDREAFKIPSLESEEGQKQLARGGIGDPRSGQHRVAPERAGSRGAVRRGGAGGGPVRLSRDPASGQIVGGPRRPDPRRRADRAGGLDYADTTALAGWSAKAQPAGKRHAGTADLEDLAARKKLGYVRTAAVAAGDGTPDPARTAAAKDPGKHAGAAEQFKHGSRHEEDDESRAKYAGDFYGDEKPTPTRSPYRWATRQQQRDAFSRIAPRRPTPSTRESKQHLKDLGLGLNVSQSRLTELIKQELREIMDLPSDLSAPASEAELKMDALSSGWEKLITDRILDGEAGIWSNTEVVDPIDGERRLLDEFLAILGNYVVSDEIDEGDANDLVRSIADRISDNLFEPSPHEWGIAPPKWEGEPFGEYDLDAENERGRPRRPEGLEEGGYAGHHEDKHPFAGDIESDELVEELQAVVAKWEPQTEEGVAYEADILEILDRWEEPLQLSAPNAEDIERLKQGLRRQKSPRSPGDFRHWRDRWEK